MTRRQYDLGNHLSDEEVLAAVKRVKHWACVDSCRDEVTGTLGNFVISIKDNYGPTEFNSHFSNAITVNIRSNYGNLIGVNQYGYGSEMHRLYVRAQDNALMGQSILRETFRALLRRNKPDTTNFPRYEWQPRPSSYKVMRKGLLT